MDVGLRWRKVVLLSYLQYDYEWRRVYVIESSVFEAMRLEEHVLCMGSLSIEKVTAMLIKLGLKLPEY